MAHICRCFYRLAVKTLYLIPVIIHYRQSLVQMKLPVISILVLTFIIIQTVGAVGALLDFADQASPADGMHRSRRDKECLPLSDGHTV